MIELNRNPHPLKHAAIMYRPADDIDSLLATFASDLICEGNRVGGVVQKSTNGPHGKAEFMDIIDLMTGSTIRLCQSLGSGTGAFKLDTAGLAEAASAISRAVAANVALVIVNTFSMQEAVGGGLRAEIADAVTAGRPVLTAVPEKRYDAWKTFTGSFGTTLACERRIVEDWWREVSLREKRACIAAHFRTAQDLPATGDIRGALRFGARSRADHSIGRCGQG